MMYRCKGTLSYNIITTYIIAIVVLLCLKINCSWHNSKINHKTLKMYISAIMTICGFIMIQKQQVIACPNYKTIVEGIGDFHDGLKELHIPP